MDQLILISPYRKITNESRFVIVDGKVIDGCIYMIDGEKIQERLFDQLAFNYVNKIKDLYKPDEAYTLDISFIEDTKEYKILEINSMCCAGLYQIDIDKMVESINKVVEKSYNDYWGYKK